MDFGNLIWLVIILMAVQPLIAARWLRMMRAAKLAHIQRKRGSRAIAIIHRQEAMRFFGMLLARYIDMNDAEEVLRAIRIAPPKQPLDIILHTPGGLAIAALQIGRALRAHPGRVTVFVPHFAMSGGTLIALAADEIVMSPHAVLGPVDPQINGMPAASIIKAVNDKPLSDIDDQTLIYADVGQKAINQLKRSARQLLRAQMPDDTADKLIDELTRGRWTHDYPISPEEAGDLGLNISTEMPEDVLNFLSLFPQPTRSGGGVESGPD